MEKNIYYESRLKKLEERNKELEFTIKVLIERVEHLEYINERTDFDIDNIYKTLSDVVVVSENS